MSTCHASPPSTVSRGGLARRVSIFAFAVFVPFMLADAAKASDPFYDRLLRDGIDAYEGGDHAVAARSLRLACFGLLEEPKVLARGLTYLALAQAELGDELEFSKTFGRILEVERRFRSFSLLELDADLRQIFDAYLYRWITLDRLERALVFRQVALRKRASRVLELSPAERRLELKRLVAAEPENSTWGLLLAELQLASGEFEAVLEAAEAALVRDPRLEQALCLRGRAGAATSSCEQALADLESCHESVDRMALTEARLGCLIQLRDWQSASRLLAEVPPAQQKKPPFRQLARDLKKGRRTAPRPVKGPSIAAAQDEIPPSPPSEGTPGPGGGAEDDSTIGPSEAPSAESEVAVASPDPTETPDDTALEAPVSDDASTWPPGLKAELDRIRQIVPNATRGELDEAFAVTRELADRYPHVTEPQHLTAEIAYRLSRWQDAVALFERGGEPEPSQPDRLFYFSVALYETGAQADARRLLERCLPSLEMTAFVRSYVGEILGVDS